MILFNCLNRSEDVLGEDWCDYYYYYDYYCWLPKQVMTSFL